MLRTETKEDGLTRIRYRFDSWSDFISYVETAKRQKGAGNSSVQERGATWCPHSFEESIALARTGWYDIAEKIESLAHRMTESNKGSLGERVSFEMSVTGEEYDVASLLAGVPECMYLPTSEITSGKRIYRIGVQTNANCSIQASSFIQQGAMACALASAIEQIGQTCEIVAYQSNRGYYDPSLRHEVYVPVMLAGDSIDVPFLAFALAHPANFRRFGFRIMESDPQFYGLGANETGGYGYTGTDVPKDLDIVLPSVEEVSRWSVERCAEWVKKTAQGMIERE